VLEHPLQEIALLLLQPALPPQLAAARAATVEHQMAVTAQQARHQAARVAEVGRRRPAQFEQVAVALPEGSFSRIHQ